MYSGLSLGAAISQVESGRYPAQVETEFHTDDNGEGTKKESGHLGSHPQNDVTGQMELPQSW